MSETDPNDQLTDHNQKKEFADHESPADDQINSSNQLGELNFSVKRKKSSRRSSSPAKECGVEERETNRAAENDEQPSIDTARSDDSDKLENSPTSKSKRTRRSARMSEQNSEEDSSHLESSREEQEPVNEQEEQEEPANEQADKPQSPSTEKPVEEESEDKRNQNAMRALFSRLQGVDSEPADLLSACNKKKKKTKCSPMELADQERGREQQKRNKRKDDEQPSDGENADEEMQCDEDERASSLNQSWSSAYGHKKTTRPTNKLLNDPMNGLPTEAGQLTGSNKKRKLNQQAKSSPSNPLISQLNSKDLAAGDMLAKYQSQFAQLSQQLLLNNPMNANEQLMNSFLAAAVASPSNHLVGALSSNLSSLASPSNLAAASPSPKSSSINTSSSLDKLTSIVDSIDKINVNQTKASSSASSNNGLTASLTGGNSTPGLSDSDNGSNLLLQLPTLSSLNKPLQSKGSPSALFGTSPAAFQDVFNNMKLLPHQLLELQQQQSQLFQPAPIKSPSSSSTHSSHSSSPSPNFFAKQSSNTLSSLASTLSGLTSQLTSNQLTAKQLAAKKSSGGNSHSKSPANQVLSANQSIKLSQQQQLNNLLRQHAALQMLQQQAEQEEMFDELENKDDDEEEEDAFDFNSQLLKQIKKQMQKSKPDEPLVNTSPLDLSCKQAKDAGAQSALNALIASKLLESGGAAGLAGLSGLQNLAGLGSLLGSPALTGHLAGSLGINNLNQLNQLNSLLSANNLLNTNQNKQPQQFGRFDLLSSLLGASNQQQQQQQSLAAAINPLLGLSLNQPLQSQSQGSKKKDQQTGGSFNKNSSSPSNSGQLLGSQLVNPNSGSNFWNLSATAKIKPYSASSSLHTPNPKAMQLRERSSSGQGRANPWQTQWMNRSSEQNRDVFTCVYCRMTFNSLDEMTQHMKVSPRCGMAGMQQANAVSAASSSTHSGGSNANSVSTTASSAERTLTSVSGLSSTASQPPIKSKHSTGSSAAVANLSSSASLMLGKEKDKSGNQVPRKLVRGQDVWLGRGAEQTRQILKCIWCQESFKTLDDLSKHMQLTQHFMNIISPEQITSWKTPEEKSQQSQMNQVLTCKVCDESFPSLKELSNHIQKTSHFKDNNLLLAGKQADAKLSDRQSPSGLSTTSSTSAGGLSNQSTHNDQSLSNGNPKKNRNASNGSASQSAAAASGGKEKRKKSLPVRKLLELERNVPGSNGQQASPLDSASANHSLSKSLLESMNRLFGGSTSDPSDKLRNGYNVDTLSTHSNEESESSLQTSGAPSNGAASAQQPQQSQSITCDECKESMDLSQFIIHLKHCKAAGGQNAQLLSLLVAAAQQEQQSREDNKSPVNNLDDSIENDDDEDPDEAHKLNGSARRGSKREPKEPAASSPGEHCESRQSGASSGGGNHSDANSNRGTPQLNGLSPKPAGKDEKGGSVLSALEQLIEKSFDSKSKKSTTNQGILQRLGIDEEINPPVPWQTNLNANSPPSTTASGILPNTNSFFQWSP